MEAGRSSPHWLRQYGNTERYQWRKTQIDGRNAFYRPLGFIEFSFDTDGRYFEGRADINNLIEVQIRSNLTKKAFRERILLAWACLRCRHSLLRARTLQDRSIDPDSFSPLGMHFLVDILEDLQQAKDDAIPHVVFLEDYFEHVDARDFFYHCQNVARIVNPDVSLSRLFVFPMHTTDGTTTLRLLSIGGHEIWDGLASHVWNRDFIQLLNDPVDVLHRKIISAINPDRLAVSLPLPQEALYPAISGSVARQRWFWAILRILRHVRRPLRPGILNPLLRSGPKVPPVPLNPTFHPVLPYTRLPVLTTQNFAATIPTRAAARLHRICRAAGTSVGAGCFALVALVGMELHSERYGEDSTSAATGRPDVFIAGFPLDARALVAGATTPPPPAENMMLAFSDGIALPFLPVGLDLEGRLRLLARRAHAQLAAYQKNKARKPEGCLTSRGAGLVLANQYVAGWEKADGMESADRGTGGSAQGVYPARRNPTPHTHGVSSVGRRDAILRRGAHSLDDPSKDFAADFVNMSMGVRAREDEFLVGIGGFEDGIYVSATADMSVIDPVLVTQWQTRLEHILDDLNDTEQAKL